MLPRKVENLGNKKSDRRWQVYMTEVFTFHLILIKVLVNRVLAKKHGYIKFTWDLLYAL